MGLVTVRTRAELIVAVNDDLPNNSSGAITPNVHRGLLHDVLDSVVVGRRGVVLEVASFTDGSTGSAAHGLGAAPNRLDVYLECTTAANGYAVGDRYYAVKSRRIGVYADDTNVGVRNIDTTIVPKSTGNPAAPAAGSWKLVVTPWILDASTP